MNEESERLSEIERKIDTQMQRLDAMHEDLRILEAKDNAILFAVSIFGTMSVLAVIAAALLLRR